jgi:hypothetical protein
MRKRCDTLNRIAEDTALVLSIVERRTCVSKRPSVVIAKKHKKAGCDSAEAGWVPPAQGITESRQSDPALSIY